MHGRHVAESHQEAHPGPVAAAQVNPLHAPPDARALGQIHGRLEPANVDLLAHHQFPEVSFGPAIHRLHILQSNVLY